jgi:excisionase family DNA binding protein
MSSNIEIKRICEHCSNVFVARTTKTRYCSHICNRRAYKSQLKQDKIQQSDQETLQAMQLPQSDVVATTVVIQKETINVKELAVMLGVSERTLFRLIKEEQFPKIKVGRRLLFSKQMVIDFITSKYKIQCVAS